MTARKPKLELTWIGKENRPKLEPRILLEDPEKSYHAAFRVREPKKLTAENAKNAEKDESLRSMRSLRLNEPGDLFDNRLIFGDNLLALKALEQEFAGKVKCIYIDPPYNTGSAFTHYDDGIEHSLWLSLMRDRLELLRRLLTADGSIWISIDDNECHYLKVLCDEVYGRSNFIANIVWQSKDTPGNNASAIAETHNHILVYRRDPAFRPNLLERSEKQIANYSNPDDDARGPWLAAPLTRAEHRDRDYYALTNPVGKKVHPQKAAVGGDRRIR
jgi:adenine-specific DNA-methyltransferase